MRSSQSACVWWRDARVVKIEGGIPTPLNFDFPSTVTDVVVVFVLGGGGGVAPPWLGCVGPRQRLCVCQRVMEDR